MANTNKNANLSALLDCVADPNMVVSNAKFTQIPNTMVFYVRIGLAQVTKLANSLVYF